MLKVHTMKTGMYLGRAYLILVAMQWLATTTLIISFVLQHLTQFSLFHTAYSNCNRTSQRACELAQLFSTKHIWVQTNFVTTF